MSLHWQNMLDLTIFSSSSFSLLSSRRTFTSFSIKAFKENMFCFRSIWKCTINKVNLPRVNCFQLKKKITTTQTAKNPSTAHRTLNLILTSFCLQFYTSLHRRLCFKIFFLLSFASDFFFTFRSKSGTVRNRKYASTKCSQTQGGERKKWTTNF